MRSMLFNLCLVGFVLLGALLRRCIELGARRDLCDTTEDRNAITEYELRHGGMAHEYAGQLTATFVLHEHTIVGDGADDRSAGGAARPDGGEHRRGGDPQRPGSGGGDAGAAAGSAAAPGQVGLQSAADSGAAGSPKNIRFSLRGMGACFSKAAIDVWIVHPFGALSSSSSPLESPSRSLLSRLPLNWRGCSCTTM